MSNRYLLHPFVVIVSWDHPSLILVIENINFSLIFPDF